MADKKISQLTSATTPLAGTEVLPIVQDNTTKQVSVANLTVGRPTSTTELTVSTGNVIISTSGKGIDFSATTNDNGTMTSELLADYEEGTWTPSVGGNATYITNAGTYTKVGRVVSITGQLKINVLGSGSAYLITGLPYNAANNSIDSSVYVGIWSSLATTPVFMSGRLYANSPAIELQGTTTGTANLSALSVLNNNSEIYFSCSYITA